jgi:hypothetical protein
MGIIVKRTVTDSNGQKMVIDSSIKQDVMCAFCCDSTRCSARNDGPNTFFSWNEEDAIRDATSLPDSFSGLIRIFPDPWQADYYVAVCSPQCGKDYLTYMYQRPKTPRQLKQEADERLKVNPEAQAAIDAQDPQMRLPFSEEAAQSIEKNAELLQMLADSDATGYKESE